MKQLNEDQRNLYWDVRSLEIRIRVIERDINEIKGELQEIKSNTTWVLRLIIGGLMIVIPWTYKMCD